MILVKLLSLAGFLSKFSSGKEHLPSRNPGEDTPHLWPNTYALDTDTHNVVKRSFP